MSSYGVGNQLPLLFQDVLTVIPQECCLPDLAATCTSKQASRFNGVRKLKEGKHAVIWIMLLLDRLHINIALFQEQYEAYKELLYTAEKYKDEDFPGINIKVYKRDYITCFTYGQKGKKPIAEIELGSAKNKHKYLSLHLYPSRFTKDLFEQFKADLPNIIPDLTYKRLYEEGRVGYIELARDCLSLARDNLLPYRRYIQSSHVVIEPDTQYRGTISLGSTKSKLRFRIYDKKRQLQKVDEPNVIGSKSLNRTRCEVSWRHIKMSPSEVGSKLKNLFEGFECFDLAACRNLSADKDWQAFLDACRDEGTIAALRKRPKQRKQYLAMLRSRPVPYFNPAGGWSGLANAMAVTAP